MRVFEPTQPYGRAFAEGDPGNDRQVRRERAATLGEGLPDAKRK